MEICTIGFTKRTARDFFGTLREAGIARLIDVRLNNTSQLAAFAKREDLEFFLQELLGAEYVHEPLLAPTQELLDDFKKREGSWEDYEVNFLLLMAKRRVEEVLNRDLFSKKSVLLCSEKDAHHCHRRLVAEYLQDNWPDVTITHL